MLRNSSLAMLPPFFAMSPYSKRRELSCRLQRQAGEAKKGAQSCVTNDTLRQFILKEVLHLDIKVGERIIVDFKCRDAYGEAASRAGENFNKPVLEGDPVMLCMQMPAATAGGAFRDR